VIEFDDIDSSLVKDVEDGRIGPVIEKIALNGVSEGTARGVLSKLIEKNLLFCFVGEGKARGAWSSWISHELIKEFFRKCHDFTSEGGDFPESFAVGKIRTGKEIVLRPSDLFLNNIKGGVGKMQDSLDRKDFIGAIDIAVREDVSDKSLRLIVSFLVGNGLISFNGTKVNLDKINPLWIRQFLRTCRLMKPPYQFVSNAKMVIVPDEMFLRGENGEVVPLSIKPLKEKLFTKWEPLGASSHAS